HRSPHTFIRSSWTGSCSVGSVCESTMTLRYPGARVKRVEDPGLLRGGGRYVAERELPRALSVAFGRSPHAHARVARIDTGAVRAFAGVVDVVTGDELRMVTKPLVPRLEGEGFTPTAAWALSDGVARFCGEAVAAVVATSPYVAADARELVAIDWEVLPVVTTLDAPLARPGIRFG